VQIADGPAGPQNWSIIRRPAFGAQGTVIDSSNTGHGQSYRVKADWGRVEWYNEEELVSEEKEWTEDEIGRLLGKLDIGTLSPIERRLADLCVAFFPQMVIQVRVDTEHGKIKALDREMVSAAVRLSLVAAVEVDDELRKLRNTLNGRRG
jgi:hypothetical protein